MNKFCFYSLIFFVKAVSAGSDVGYTYTQSSSSQSHKIKAGVQIFPDHKLSLSYSKTALDPATNPDTVSSVFKAAYKYKINSDFNIGGEFKKTNDTYFFEGHSEALQTTAKFYSIEGENDSTLDSSINFKIEAQNKNYSKNINESYTNLNFTMGLDQDLPNGFSVGADYSQNNYNSSSILLKSAIDSQTTLNTDINSYTLLFVKKSTSVYIDYAYSFFTVGLNYSLDMSWFANQSNYSTTEIYGDFDLSNNIVLNASLSNGKSDTGVASTTTSLGLQYRF